MTGAVETTGTPIDDARLPVLFSSLTNYDALVVAVSGGADSIALLHLISAWRDSDPTRQSADVPEIIVATVDHGLRPEAKSEAAFVARKSAELGLIHKTVTWTGEKPETGLQDAARIARYRLLEGVALAHWPKNRAAIVTAHTRDDQVETFLMRLARGSGLDGLTAMDCVRRLGPLTEVDLVRPLLDVSKADLIATLQSRGIDWQEDQSNYDTRFERVRLREIQHTLDELGLTQNNVAKSIRRLRRANNVLEHDVAVLARNARLQLHSGVMARFDLAEFTDSFEELRVRFLARVIRAYGGQLLQPRLAKVEAMVDRLTTGGITTQTLGGCVVRLEDGVVTITREPARQPLPVEVMSPGDVALWDHRFRVVHRAEEASPVVVQALGSDARGLIAPTHERAGVIAVDRQLVAAAETLPAFWREGQLIAVPFLPCLFAQTPEIETFTAEFVFTGLFDHHDH